jgi:hypothetical protein
VCPIRVLLFDFVLLDLTTLFSSCTVLIFHPATTAAKAIIFFLRTVAIWRGLDPFLIFLSLSIRFVWTSFYRFSLLAAEYFHLALSLAHAGSCVPYQNHFLSCPLARVLVPAAPVCSCVSPLPLSALLLNSVFGLSWKLAGIRFGFDFVTPPIFVPVCIRISPAKDWTGQSTSSLVWFS